MRFETDERLVGLCRDASAPLMQAIAQQAVVERYHEPLLRYCTRFMNRADAEDIVQQAFERTLPVLLDNDRELLLKPWLYRVTHNLAINQMSLKRAVPTDTIESVGDGSPAPEVEFERSQRIAGLVDDIRALPERQRAALVMRDFEGRSYDDVAKALDSNATNARKLTQLARKRLRDGLGILFPAPSLPGVWKRIELWLGKTGNQLTGVASAAAPIAAAVVVLGGGVVASTEVATGKRGGTAASPARASVALAADTGLRAGGGDSVANLAWAKSPDAALQDHGLLAPQSKPAIGTAAPATLAAAGVPNGSAASVAATAPDPRSALEQRRDAVAMERAITRERRAEVRGERGVVRDQRQNVRAERQTLKGQRRELAETRSRLRAQGVDRQTARGKLGVQKQAMKQQRKRVANEQRKTQQQQKIVVDRQRDVQSQQKKVQQRQREVAQQQRENVRQRSEQAAAQRQAAAQQRQAAAQQRQAAAQQRQAAAQQRQAAAQQRAQNKAARQGAASAPESPQP